MTLPFNPDWTLAPAALLNEWLDEHPGITPQILADACARGDELPAVEAELLIGEVLDRKPLRSIHAAVLERGTHIPARHWLNWEKQYRAGLAAGRKDVTRG